MTPSSPLNFGQTFVPPTGRPAADEYWRRLAAHLGSSRASNTAALYQLSRAVISAEIRWQIALVSSELRRVLTSAGELAGIAVQPTHQIELLSILSLAVRLRITLNRTTHLQALDLAKRIAKHYLNSPTGQSAGANVEAKQRIGRPGLIQSDPDRLKEALAEAQIQLTNKPDHPGSIEGLVLQAFHYIRRSCQPDILAPSASSLGLLRKADMELAAAKQSLATYAAIAFGHEVDIQLQKIPRTAVAFALLDVFDQIDIKPGEARGWVDDYLKRSASLHHSKAKDVCPKRIVRLWTPKDVEKIEVAFAHLAREESCRQMLKRLDAGEVGLLEAILHALPDTLKPVGEDDLSDRLGLQVRIPEIYEGGLWRVKAQLQNASRFQRIPAEMVPQLTVLSAAVRSAIARTGAYGDQVADNADPVDRLIGQAFEKYREFVRLSKGLCQSQKLGPRRPPQTGPLMAGSNWAT